MLNFKWNLLLFSAIEVILLDQRHNAYVHIGSRYDVFLTDLCISEVQMTCYMKCVMLLMEILFARALSPASIKHWSFEPGNWYWQVFPAICPTIRLNHANRVRSHFLPNRNVAHFYLGDGRPSPEAWPAAEVAVRALLMIIPLIFMAEISLRS